MTFPQEVEHNRQRPLRLWPGVVAVALQWFLWLAVPMIVPEAAALSMAATLLGGTLAVLVWWLFFSRAPLLERWAAVVLMVGAAALTQRMVHESVLFVTFSVPVLCLALVVWAMATRRLADPARRVALVATALVACGLCAAVRTDGVTGGFRAHLSFRWNKTPEQQLLARSGGEPAALVPQKSPEQPAPAPQSAVEPSAPPVSLRASLPATLPIPRTTAPANADWPGFRGPHRDSVVSGVRIKTDWAASPPVELWRRPVGPGWSSFAVGGGLIYTQEQRGDFEVVSCYNAANGEPVWTHRDSARFSEPAGGAGPRGTPTIHQGRIYALGATGILNALDAGSGAVVWTRNAASDTGAQLPEWGFSGSPLVVDDEVIVAASGQLAAYDLSTGAPRWRQPTGRGSYGYPQLLTLGGVPQVVLLNGAGATSVAPADGAVLWKHSWAGAAILQPALTPDGAVLIAIGGAVALGTRRLAIAHGPGGWTAEEVWTSTGLKPFFNDMVVHNGYAFGFDGSILSCIDLKDGKRKWKGGRYGNGQMLLLSDQNLLLVLAEEGELALVAAAPEQFTEIARFPAMTDKTWNHPVLVGDLLLVRNGREMVAFRLSLTGG